MLTQSIHSFCVNELGAFYLDIIKDRQYTCKKNSQERLSSQHAMYCILKMLLLWIAPICPHTSEEAWGFIPKNKDKSILRIIPCNSKIIINRTELKKVYLIQ